MDERKPIAPNPPRWSPSADPASIEVPGLDTTASVHDQIEQIEQLITIKLQNIDENFSKIHTALANRILPAVKRYAVGTEPVREAAKFWTSFYEQAAQIRIPTYDDYSTVNEQPSDRAEESETTSSTQENAESSRQQSQLYQNQDSRYEASVAQSETSFAPSQAAFSSTPATTRTAPFQSFKGQEPSDAESSAWSASVESPLVRLDRELQSLSREEENLSGVPNLNELLPTPSRSKGKGKDHSQPLLRNVLRQTLYTGDDPADAPTPSFHTSPLKSKGKLKTPIPKKMNPYLPPNSNPNKWNGVVDLRDPSMTTPRRFAPSFRASSPVDASDDSWEGDLPPGMSPPTMMSPARPPRSSAELGLLKLGQTPMREAAARITRDLVSDIQRKSSGPKKAFTYESSMSTVATPPSLSRYMSRAYDTDSTGVDPSLDSAMGRMTMTPGAFQAAQDPMTPDGFDPLDDDSFSDDEVNTTAHPSAAFLMASARRSADDSLDSDEEDMDEPSVEGEPVHPFDRIPNDSYDDSFDHDVSFDSPVVGRRDEATDTLFGPRQGGNNHGDGRLLLHGLGVFDDTTGISSQLDSPTPGHWKQQ
ncbi:DASH complex subunit Ask1-domain-containing protein [Mycena floridula]|nr:DASH complex subunit Ask1-domain-containing protein [Mycena floridula]